MEKTESTKAILTCPFCKNTQEEIIPIDACQYFYKCDNCKKTVKSKGEDCCVFCSYGSRKCFTAKK